MPLSLERDPSCLAFLPSNSRLLAPLSQHQSSQVIMCSPGLWLKSFHISHSSLRDRDQVVTSGSASLHHVLMIALLHHPLLNKLTFLSISFCVQGQLIPAQVGSLIQLVNGI